ncbi:hypothetical protein CQA53_11770, partial [Helicobacter didelphidarum]
MNKTKSLNFQRQEALSRREALKKLKSFSLVSLAGGLYGSLSLSYLWNHHKDSTIDSNTLGLSQDSTRDTPLQASHLIESNLIESTHNISLDSLTYPFHSNLSDEILSLPLKYFSIPNSLSFVLETHLKRHSDTMLIIPLITSKDFNHTRYSLYHAYNVNNINTHTIYNETSSFLRYHYDSLKSLVSDLESKGFVMRDMRGSNNLFIQPLQTQDSLLLSEILSLLIIDEKR